MTNEKSETQAAWGNQEIGRVVHDPNSPRGVQGVSSSNESVNVGAGRTDWPWENSPIGILLGGILEQLLESHRNRLSETRECVEWYQREEEKTLELIKKLEQLQQVALSDNLQDGNSQASTTTDEEE